ELAVRDAATAAARLAAALAGDSARPPSPAAPRSRVQAVRLWPGDRLAVVPFEHARDVPNYSADDTHIAATRLTLSH
ncbi:hypothetical protein AAHH80_40430, partial [Burkholderia pseudomallei]